MHQAQWSPERPLPPPVSLTSQSHHEKPPDSVVFDSSRPRGPRPTGLLRPWEFPGERTGVGCHGLGLGLGLGLGQADGWQILFDIMQP